MPRRLRKVACVGAWLKLASRHLQFLALVEAVTRTHSGDVLSVTSLRA
jgi:hypothetical protein